MRKFMKGVLAAPVVRNYGLVLDCLSDDYLVLQITTDCPPVEPNMDAPLYMPSGSTRALVNRATLYSGYSTCCVRGAI